ncbi:MAG TPA: ABC transporter permease subunit [Xanthobacteraceae bacterium]|nr:ABC transporter permease subunit [Xanthobacteraceae bacterium]
MATTGNLTAAPLAARPVLGAVTLLRIAILITIVAIWEAVAASGWLFRDVVPSLLIIGRQLVLILTHPDYLLHIDLGFGSSLVFDLKIPEFYRHLWVTVSEVATAMVIGGIAGLAVGLALGANPFLSNAFERFLYWLGPTPKIIFFPIMIMWFGVGPGSKVAMGTLSCFFPVALSVAAGMRQIEKVLIRVGKSFRANTWQMITKIYLPAMRQPIVNGARLGMGVAVIGTLLAETKLSNRGVGFLIINAYSTFDMPRMYALLIVLFVVAIGANALVARASRG